MFVHKYSLAVVHGVSKVSCVTCIQKNRAKVLKI